MSDDLRKEILSQLEKLSESQIRYVHGVVSGLLGPVKKSGLPQSDVISDCFLDEFCNEIQAHHGLSDKALTKAQFEYAIERVLRKCGRAAQLAPSGNPGHDITVDGVRYSLKSQADKNIHSDSLWISKYMELGKGDWSDKPEQLIGLRKQFFDHMSHYERILVLRAFAKKASEKTKWKYELVEIPKSLLQQAESGELEMKLDSSQTPKPGYCTVADDAGVKFQLYFDGGTERKLQIKNIRKTGCIVHGTWEI